MKLESFTLEFHYEQKRKNRVNQALEAQVIFKKKKKKAKTIEIEH